MNNMPLKGKKLLILAGAGVHSKVVKAAKQMGIYTVVTDYLPDSPAKLIADETWMYDIKDVDAIVERCKVEKIDGVMNFQIDPAQKPYQEICEKLGLPCTATKEQFDIFTDKCKFKEFCVANNVDIIPEYSEADILEDKASYPVFIKPNDSRGSRGQAVCYTKAEALKALEIAKKHSSNGKAICEKYMKNHQDIGSAFFVIDSEPYLVKFGDRLLGKEEDGLQKQVMCTRLPSTFAPTFEEKVMPRVKNMIKNLGIKFGPVFLQGFIDGDTIRYYDPALRMPGGDYDLILKKATGFDTVKTFIYFALTGDTSAQVGDPQNSYKLSGGTALLVTPSVKAGRISKIQGFQEVLNSENTIYGRQLLKEGEIVTSGGDIGQRAAAFGLYAPQDHSPNELLQKLYDTYKIKNEEEEDMIISKIYLGV